jgi:hypothetical protein
MWHYAQVLALQRFWRRIKQFKTVTAAVRRRVLE